MADALHRGSTELAVLVPELWSARFYETLKENLPYESVINHDYEGEIRALGDTVNITEFPQFADADLISEDQDVDARAVTAVGYQLVINKQIVCDYIVTDRARVQTLEHSNALRDLSAFAIMKKVESEIIAAIVPDIAHQLSYAVAGTLGLADILAGKEKLDEDNVPDDGLRCMVMDAPQWNDIFNITGLTSRDFISAGSPLQSGSLPAQVLGFNPKMSTLNSGTTYQFHPSFMTIAFQRELEVKVFDKGVEGIRAERVNSSVLMGLLQMDGSRVVSLS